MNGPNRIEYEIKRDQINQFISKVSDIFINAGLKLDNFGSIKLSFEKDLISYYHTKLISQAHSKNVHVGVKFLFNSQFEF